MTGVDYEFRTRRVRARAVESGFRIQSHYGLCLRILKSANFESCLRLASPTSEEGSGISRKGDLLASDGREHLTLRRVARLVIPKGPSAVGLAREALERVHWQPESGIDVVAGFAKPYASEVAFEMLGVPRTDHEFVRTELEHLWGSLDERIGWQRERSGVHLYLTQYLQQLQRKKDSKIAVIADAFGSGLISREAATVLPVQLLHAAYENTANLIGLVAAEALAGNREESEGDWGTEPIALAIARLSPVGLLVRRVREDCIVAGTSYAGGEHVALLIAEANRDVALGKDGQERSSAPGLAFGAGHHVCPGARIATVEAMLARRRLLEFDNRLRSASADFDFDSASWGPLHLSISRSTGVGQI